MLGLNSDYFQQTRNRPPIVFVFLTRLISFLPLFTIRPWFRSLTRYLVSTRLKDDSTDLKSTGNPKIEIVFVTTQKDFNSLKFAIPASVSSCSFQESVNIKLIVPQIDVAQANIIAGLFPHLSISVVPEEDMIPSDSLIAIKERFGWRAGWVIQQILKVEAVRNSNFPGVLIIDSDTVLLQPRLWLDHELNQLLCASWEYNRPYYEFLNKKSLCEIVPKYTFVTHHMLMQPRFLREALEIAGWDNLESLVSDLINTSDQNEVSPFCIEYELYGQYMIHLRADKVKLRKWSNISVPPSGLPEGSLTPEFLASMRNKYYSISLHSYLE